MKKHVGNNVIEFPGEYLIEQRKLDRWLTIASCSIVMGSDEPMANVDIILDKFGDAPSRKPAEIVAHARFAGRSLPEAVNPDDIQEVALAATETVFNQWIDAWLPRSLR
ncbi:MAG: hypothetical protein R3D62_11210 [Xanthobacteraceae bacterium]